MESVKIVVTSDEQASRLELLVRIIWGAIVGFVLGLVGIVAGVFTFIQWFHILFLGRRHAGMQKFVNAYMTGMTQLNFYLLLSTDERPPVLPQF